VDSIFGIGLGELLLILIIAGLVLGPQRIFQVARQLGLIVGRWQKMTQEFMRQLNSELQLEELQAARKDLQDARREIDAVLREVARTQNAAADEGRQLWQEGDAAVKGATPPAAKPKKPLPRPVDVPGDAE
jgi:sec-independent protein translocase protein TatB